MKDILISIGIIIIDDIILPDGQSKMGTLGGGATHAVMGMRIWTDFVGLVVSVGKDFSGSYLDNLNKKFDLKSLIIRPSDPTPRAWQLFEGDGTRTEVFRTDYDRFLSMIPRPEELPAEYDHVGGVHLHCSQDDVASWVPVLREKGCQIILWEPWDEFCIPDNLELFYKTCELVDIVSPSISDMCHLTSLEDSNEILNHMQENGAKVVLLRMAEKGSIVAGQQQERYHIPAYPQNPIVDVTGAGNACCGGFIAGFARTHSLKEAGYYAAISASLTLRQFGAVYSLAEIEQETTKRLAWYHKNDAKMAKSS